MIQIPDARIIDINSLVRLRKHLSWAGPWVGALGLVGYVPFSTLELRDSALIGVDGVLAFTIYLVFTMGWVKAIPPLAIALAALNTVLTGRYVFASWPIDTKDERGLVAVGVMAMAVSLWVLYIAFAPFFREARRSPYLDLVFATKRTLGVDYAGESLSWKAWFRQLRPWVVVVGILTYVVAFAAMLIASKATGKRDKALEKTIRDAVFAAGGMLFVWSKRKSALRGTVVREIDRRPPVLLLRSFGDDMMAVKGERGSRATDLHRKGMTFERVIQDHLSPFGPFVAIGRPEEPLSPLGAARDYVPDSDWQDEVQQRIQAAAIVVLIIGTLPGSRLGTGAAARPGAAAQADSALSARRRCRQPVGDARRARPGIRPSDPPRRNPARGNAGAHLRRRSDAPRHRGEARRVVLRDRPADRGDARDHDRRRTGAQWRIMCSRMHARRGLVAQAFRPANGRPGSPKGLRYD